MLTKIPFKSLGAANYGWLQARYHFSFSQYYDADRTGFGALLVINDDRIEAGKGFAPHPHDNMEIITYVRRGAITHKDSLGNEGVTHTGDVQVMSAGTGVTHSEYNLSDEQCVLYQIWILPRARGVAPRWDAAAFPKQEVRDVLPLLVSGFEEDAGKGALYIHQDARIYGGTLAMGAVIEHGLQQHAYLLVSEGVIKIGDEVLEAGDGAKITGESVIKIQAMITSTVLVIEVPHA